MAVAGVWLALCMAVAVLAHTAAVFALATAACSPAEIAWFVVAAGVEHRIAPVANSGFYQGIWSMTTAVAAVVSPTLVACALPLGGRPVLAVAMVVVGLIGPACCPQLARSFSSVNSR